MHRVRDHQSRDERYDGDRRPGASGHEPPAPAPRAAGPAWRPSQRYALGYLCWRVLVSLDHGQHIAIRAPQRVLDPGQLPRLHDCSLSSLASAASARDAVDETVALVTPSVAAIS